MVRAGKVQTVKNLVPCTSVYDFQSELSGHSTVRKKNSTYLINSTSSVNFKVISFKQRHSNIFNKNFVRRFRIFYMFLYR